MATSQLQLDYRTLLLLCAQWLLFVGNFVLYVTSPGPLIAHIFIGVLAIHLAFTIWHEAAHGTVANRKWINNAVGILGMFPYTTPYFMQRFVHLDHHKFLNDPERDPNQIYAGGPFWQLPIRYFEAIGYARRMLSDDPRTSAMRLSDNFFMALTAGIYIVAYFQGLLVDLILLWLLPVVIAKVIMDWYVNYLPHVGLPQDRFLGTRIIDVPWLTPLVIGHNYHAIHHLWPTIPWHAYTARYNEKIDYLRENDVPIEKRLIGGRLYPTRRDAGGTPKREDAQQQES